MERPRTLCYSAEAEIHTYVGTSNHDYLAIYYPASFWPLLVSYYGTTVSIRSRMVTNCLLRVYIRYSVQIPPSF